MVAFCLLLLWLPEFRSANSGARAGFRNCKSDENRRDLMAALKSHFPSFHLGVGIHKRFCQSPFGFCVRPTARHSRPGIWDISGRNHAFFGRVLPTNGWVQLHKTDVRDRLPQLSWKKSQNDNVCLSEDPLYGRLYFYTNRRMALPVTSRAFTKK